MKQVIQNYRTGMLEVAEVPSPTVRPGTLLIRTVTSVVSAGTERHLVEMARKSLVGKALARPDLVRRVLEKVKTDGVAETIQQVRQRLESPVPLGYSAAGSVVAVGEGATGFQVGDPVACGGTGVAVHAEMLSAPPTLVTRVPPGVPLEAAAFAMVGAISLHAARLCQLQAGEWVAVIGLGLLGLLAVQILGAAGCRVVGLDVVPDKLMIAKDLGVEATVDSSSPDAFAAVETLTWGHGVDAVLVTAGTSSNAPLELAAKVSRVRGRIVATGLVGLDLPRHLFFDRELELIVSRASGAGLFDPSYEAHGKDYPYPYVRWTHERNMAEFLRLIATGSVQVVPLITHRFPIDRATEAYSALRGEGGAHPIGIVLEYPHRATSAPAVVRLRTSGESHAPRTTSRIGLIGAGLFARTTLLPEIRKIDGTRLVGVAAMSGANAHHVARSFGFGYATTDVQQLLQDKEVDCLFILTQHDSHARLAAAGLRAGKDVFVEKPLALTVSELLEVEEAWRSSGKRLMVGFNRRHSPHAAAARGYLAGAAGHALLHLRINAGDVPAGSWVNDPVAGGDRVRGELCHFVDLAHYLLDDSALAAEAVGVPPKNAGGPVEDLAVLLHFSRGSVANLFYTARGHRSLPRERIEGFRGGRVALIDNFQVTRFYGPGAPRARRTWRLERGYHDELKAWFTALRDGDHAPVPFAAYAASTLATLAVAQALVEQKQVTVDDTVLAACSLPR